MFDVALILLPRLQDSGMQLTVLQAGSRRLVQRRPSLDALNQRFLARVFCGAVSLTPQRLQQPARRRAIAVEGFNGALRELKQRLSDMPQASAACAASLYSVPLPTCKPV